MKVHLSNLFGNNKISHDDRVSFVETNMEKILDSVANPLEGEMWWSTAEEPFQALATMMGKCMSQRLCALYHAMLYHTKPCYTIQCYAMIEHRDTHFVLSS